MNVHARIEADRRETNPIFNDNKLKLGTFQTNLDSACLMSSLEGRFELNWPNTLAIARLADEMGFEALLPVARWRGHGGDNNPQGPGFEAMAWAAGIGASTERAGVLATSHIAMNHPIVAAKQSTVVDHITGGRYTLNIVCGWNRPEFEMFGLTILEHGDRYDMAEEWLTVVKRLWTEDDEFDFDGKYYNIKRGYLEPKPIQKPYPAVMNAGGSERGQHFAAKNCDCVFLVFPSHDPDDCRAQVDRYRRLAREEYGRELQVWSSVNIVQAETEKEARDFYNHYVHDLGDWAAADNIMATMGITAKTFPPEAMTAMKEHFIAGWGSYPVTGTRDQVVDGLQTMADIGLDGVLLSWPFYEAGMRDFRDNTLPLVKQAGLRK
jgi:alkanesulfonate monooxygenase SsuD/methylene tetrahydromethanopterin reductase-like flavin-dependent oxidoreductase (luciferase family)